MALFLALMLFSSIYIELQFNQKFTLNIKFMFIVLYKYPSPIKKKPHKKVKEKKHKAPIANIFKKDKISELSWKIKCILNQSKKSLKKIYHKTVVDDLVVSLGVSSKDKCQTALLYGRLCCVFYSFVSLVKSEKKVKKMGMNIYPDFNSEVMKVNLNLKFHIRLIVILAEALKFLRLFLKLFVFKRIKNKAV
jgi:hypothetical protein